MFPISETLSSTPEQSEASDKMPFVIIWTALIIAVPFAVLKYIRYRRNLKYKREISLDVKKRLISSENYGELGKDVLSAVKQTLLRNCIAESVIITGFFAVVIIAELLRKNDKLTIMYTIGAYILVLLIFAVRYIFGILRLSTTKNLIKIKGFVFQKSSQEFFVIYYDMPKMEYRIFTQGTFIRSEALAVPGNFVNLIGIRKKRKVKIIRILSF